MASGFCLTTDLLFCFPEKLSSEINLYESQIRVIVFSEIPDVFFRVFSPEMNCYLKSGIHEHSPKSQIHIQNLPWDRLVVFHRSS